MTGLAGLAVKSLCNRRWTAALVVLSIAVSVLLVLGVDRLRNDARSGFAATISGTDLIVGARTGSVQLLLYSVFRIGNATNNIRYRSFQDLSADARVAWAVPLSLGDSHRGFRVLGTSEEYFERYAHGEGRKLAFAEGRPFDDMFDVVIGSAVARELGYGLGDRLVVQHGVGVTMESHDDKPFTVSGILAPTGTPVDRTLHVSLAGIEGMHLGFGPRARASARNITADEARTMDLEPRAITAFLVGLKSRGATFTFQNDVAEYRGEPLMAILPGVALHELWSVMANVETALAAISACVLVSALLGMAAMLLAGLNERRREMAVLRALGAGPRHVLALLMMEAAGLTLAGAALGIAVGAIGYGLAADWLGAAYGFHLTPGLPGWREAAILAAMLGSGLLAGLIPAWRAVRQSLADGLVPRV
ncbi:MAG: ABC transporter permease [Rhodospirillales bacterium]